jgi:polygalacturonase
MITCVAVAGACGYGLVLAAAGQSVSHPQPAAAVESTVRGPVALSPSEVPADRIAPERFGARGDGSTDDTSAIQKAIDDANGRTVWLGPNRTYRVTRELRLSDDTTIEGAGPTSALVFSWFDGSGDRSGGKQYLAADSPSGAGLSDVTLSNFVIRGGGSGRPSGLGRFYPNRLACGVRLTNVTNFSLTHLKVEDTPGYGLGEFGSRHGTIAYNDIHNSGRGGIGMWWRGTNTEDIRVSNNRISRIGDDGIAVNGLPAPPSPTNHSALPTNIRIDHNSITGWPTNVNGRVLGNGIALSAVTGVKVENNSVSRTYGSGVLVVSCGHTRCAPGTGVRSDATGQAWRSTGVKVLDNKIRSAGRLYPGSTVRQTGIPTDAIFIGSAVGATVAGNVIQRPLRFGIRTLHCNRCSISRR